MAATLVFVDATAMHVCDANTAVELWSLPHQNLPVRTATFSPDGRLVGCGGYDGTVRACNAETGGELWSGRTHEGQVRTIDFSPDGRLLATGGFDRTVRIWDLASGKEVACLRGHEGIVTNVLFSPDSRLIASTCDKNTLRVWDASGGVELWCLGSSKLGCVGVATSSGGRSLMSVKTTACEAAQVVDITNESIDSRKLCDAAILSIAFSPDSRQIVAGCDVGGVRVWDLGERGVELRRLSGHNCPVRNVAVSPDGNRIVSCSTSEEIRVFNAASGDCIEVIQGNGDVCAIAMGPPQFLMRAVSRGLETIIECARTARAVAWFPMPVEGPITHNSGRIWAARAAFDGLCVLKLEGTPEANAASGSGSGPDL